jgi:hypothetical protein
MEELPSELVGAVARFLPPCEWFRLRSVNRMFHDVLSHHIVRTFERQLGSKELWASLRNMPAATAAQLLADLETTRLDASAMLAAGVLRADTLDTILGSRIHAVTHLDMYLEKFDAGVARALCDLFWDSHLPVLQAVFINVDHRMGSEFLVRELIHSILQGAPKLKLFMASFAPTMTLLCREIVLRSRNLEVLSLNGTFCESWRGLSRLLPRLEYLAIDTLYGQAAASQIEIDSVTIFSTTLVRDSLCRFLDELVYNDAMLRNMRCLIVHRVGDIDVAFVEVQLRRVFLRRPGIDRFLMSNGPELRLHYRRGPTAFVPFECGCSNFSCSTASLRERIGSR